MSLDRQIILRHAFAVLDETGLEGLTLRKLAARMEVQAPAIYWHFKNKQDLLDEMGTQVLLEAVADEATWQELPTWREWACTYCTELRKAFLRHRDGARMASGTLLTDNKLYAAMDNSLRKFMDAGFTLRQAAVGIGALYCYTVGFVIEEQATQTATGEQHPEYVVLEVRKKRLNQELYPLAAAIGADMFTNYDSRFTEGVSIVVNGLEATLAN